MKISKATACYDVSFTIRIDICHNDRKSIKIMRQVCTPFFIQRFFVRVSQKLYDASAFIKKDQIIYHVSITIRKSRWQKSFRLISILKQRCLFFEMDKILAHQTSPKECQSNQK